MKRRLKKNYLLFTFSLLLSLNCLGTEPVYVSTSGNDSFNGTFKSPYLTLEKARDVLRSERTSGEKGPYSILLKGGDYSFTKSVKFADQDKGLTIAPFKNEKVRFTGGISIDPSKAKQVVGSAKEGLFPKNNRNHILMVNLRELGITDYGELKQVGYGHPSSSLWMELFINGDPGQLSRWPNDSTIAIGKVIDKGSLSSDKKSETHGGEFTYPGNRASKWKTTEDIWISGYFKYGWADDAVKLASIDTIGKIFTTVQPHCYGFSSGEPYNAWYAYNIPEEIDAPGEYYIDRKEGILYLYNPGKIEHLEVSVLADPFIVLEKAIDITIQGITFDCARGIAVDIKNSTQCVLKDCMIRNLGSYAINIRDINENIIGKKNGLLNCSIYQTGSGGINLGGGNRQTLEPSENYVENCSIHDFNRISKTYCAGVQISGVGNRISHCEIFNAPHAAILLSGNDHLIEYNEIHHVCLSTDDVGAFYYGRNPSMRGHQLRFNYFHHLGGRHTAAVYQDDGACGMNVFSNVFYKAGTLPSVIGGGSDNSYVNNIFIDSPSAIYVDNRLQNWGKKWVIPDGIFEKELSEIKYNQPPYSLKYPELARYFEDNPGLPQRNRIDKNVFVRIKKVIDGDQKFLEFTDTNFVTNEDPGFVSEKDQNFKLKKTSVVFKKIPGFQQIPFEKIGIIK